MNVSKLTIFLLISLFLISNYGCKDEVDSVPYAYVNFYINLNDAEYNELNVVGNSIVVSGGFNGIIIHRNSFEEFLAFDRSCTYKPSKKCDLEFDASGLFTVCQCDSSIFLLIDGSPTDNTKPAEFPLKQYTTTFYEGSNTVVVQN